MRYFNSFITAAIFFAATAPIGCPFAEAIAVHVKTFASDRDTDYDALDLTEEEVNSPERKPIYHYSLTDYDEEAESDPYYRLEGDTSWPGQREDYSDSLFR